MSLIKSQTLSKENINDKQYFLNKPKQEEFCQRYVWILGNTQWNATMSYIETYKVSYESAMASGNRLLWNVKISDRIRVLFAYRYNDADIDNEIAKLIFQDDDKTCKIQAIKEYNKIKWRVQSKTNVWYDESIKAFIDKIRNHQSN